MLRDPISQRFSNLLPSGLASIKADECSPPLPCTGEDIHRDALLTKCQATDAHGEITAFAVTHGSELEALISGLSSCPDGERSTQTGARRDLQINPGNWGSRGEENGEEGIKGRAPGLPGLFASPHCWLLPGGSWLLPPPPAWGLHAGWIPFSGL